MVKKASILQGWAPHRTPILIPPYSSLPPQSRRSGKKSPPLPSGCSPRQRSPSLAVVLVYRRGIRRAEHPTQISSVAGGRGLACRLKFIITLPAGPPSVCLAASSVHACSSPWGAASPEAAMDDISGVQAAGSARVRGGEGNSSARLDPVLLNLHPTTS